MKNEYGIGGWSTVEGWLDHDAKGIKIERQDKDKIVYQIPYIEASKIIAELIANGRYQSDAICEHSKHECNREELWKIAATLDDIKCPKVCCRYCKQNIICGAVCNGTQRKEVDIYGFMDDGMCPTCGNKQLQDLQEQCDDCGQMLSWERWKVVNKEIKNENTLLI